MSKFFAQILISVALGLSAAAGFNQDVRGEVEGMLHEAETFTHERVQSVSETAASVEADSEVSVEASTEAEANFDLNSLIEDTYDLLPEASLDGSVSAEAETNVEVDADETNLSLEKTLETILDLGIETGE